MPDFDPYHRWLGIPPDQQPPSAFRLLGLSESETNPAVIQSSAKRQFNFVKSQTSGPYGAVAKRILHEILAARKALLDHSRSEVPQFGVEPANTAMASPFERQQESGEIELEDGGLGGQWPDPEASRENPFATMDREAIAEGSYGSWPEAANNAPLGGMEVIEFDVSKRRKRHNPAAKGETTFAAATPVVRPRARQSGLSPMAVGFVVLNALLFGAFMLYEKMNKGDIRAERLASQAKRALQLKGADSLATDTALPIVAVPSTPRPSPPPPSANKPVPSQTVKEADAPNRVVNEEATPKLVQTSFAPPNEPEERQEKKVDPPSNRAYVDKNREFVEFAGRTTTLAEFKDDCVYVNYANFSSIDSSMGILVEGKLGPEVGGKQTLTLIRGGKSLPLEFVFEPDKVLKKSKKYLREGEIVLAYGWVLDDPLPDPPSEALPKAIPGAPRGRAAIDGNGDVKSWKRKACVISARASREVPPGKRLQINIPPIHNIGGVVRNVPSWDLVVVSTNNSKFAANDVEIEVVITNGDKGAVVTRERIELGRVPPSNRKNPLQKEFSIDNPQPGNPVVAFVSFQIVRANFVGD